MRTRTNDCSISNAPANAVTKRTAIDQPRREAPDVWPYECRRLQREAEGTYHLADATIPSTIAESTQARHHTGRARGLPSRQRRLAASPTESRRWRVPDIRGTVGLLLQRQVADRQLRLRQGGEDGVIGSP